MRSLVLRNISTIIMMASITESEITVLKMTHNQSKYNLYVEVEVKDIVIDNYILKMSHVWLS